VSHTAEHVHKRHFSLKVGERGRVVLPVELRRRLDLRPDDRLFVTVEDDGSLRVVTARQAVASAKGMLRRWIPERDVLLSDELIADRRREAQSE
jgi:AbrB family looped-hinge helix DNA binding protein